MPSDDSFPGSFAIPLRARVPRDPTVAAPHMVGTGLPWIFGLRESDRYFSAQILVNIVHTLFVAVPSC